MSTASDVLVVGSGASGVHAAVPLVRAGLRVTLLDVGREDGACAALVPDAPFDEIRRRDASQHRFFLGDRFEGVPVGSRSRDAVPQLGPPRRHVLEGAEQLLPIEASDFVAVQSVARGGLGGAWGAVCFPFLDEELERCGLDPREIRPHYEAVARRIGVSGERADDLAALRGPLDALLPPLDLDHNAEALLARYRRRRAAFARDGVALGRPLLAVLSRPLGERRALAYHDMEFWSDAGGSVYRPEWTLRELLREARFAYRPGLLVERFEEDADGVRVRARALDGSGAPSFAARRLVLAAGTLGTARIALRSLGRYGVPVPLLTNHHGYVPCLHLRGLGQPVPARRHGLAQLTMIYDPTRDRRHLVQGQLYSYRSLLLFRLLNDSFLPVPESLRVLRSVASSLVIFVVQHEDEPSADKVCQLERGADGEDVLRVRYAASAEADRAQRRHEAVMLRQLRRLGCLPLWPVRAVPGASIHYAGPFPSTREDRPLTTAPDGRLRGTRHVSIADGAALAYLPAKGLTGTLMANADRVGTAVARELAGGSAG